MTLVGHRRAARRGHARDARTPGRRCERAGRQAARVALSGGLLIGLSTFQAEFDFGVPQFRFVFQPMLIMLAAGVGLVAARLWARPRRGARRGRLLPRRPRRAGAAGRPGPRRDDAAPPALRRRGAGRRGDRAARRRATGRWPSASGPASGIGTVGLAVRVGAGRTSGCRSRGRPSCSPRRALLGFAAAVAGAAGRRLDRRAPERRSRMPGLAARCAAPPWSAPRRSPRCVGFALYKPADEGVRAAVALTDVDRRGRAHRERRRAPEPAGRGRRRRVADRHRLAGRRPRRRPPASESAPAATAPPSRSPCTATGRR